MIHDKDRVDALRNRINAQLELIDALKAKVVKGELAALDVARNQTLDIDVLFLRDLDRNERTAVEEARWLAMGEHMLGIWVPYLKKTEAQFKTFGDRGIQIVGG